MATKQELIHTLKRTEELARKTGRLHFADSLVLKEPKGGAGVDQWGVQLKQTKHNGDTRRHSGAIVWLPDSGRSIGWTKGEAQDVLRIVNGVMVDEMARKVRSKLGYEESIG